MGLKRDGAKAKVETYNLDPRFERIVTTLACVSPKFFKRIGRIVDPEAMQQEVCKLALRAVLSFAEDSGCGPGASVLVIQRLRRWMTDGKVTLEQIREVSQMLDDEEDAGLPDENSVVSELAPILRHRFERDAAQLAVATYAKRGTWEKVTGLVQQASAVGVVDSSPGVTFGVDAFEELAKMRELSYLPTGILELDAFLDGGLRKGSEGVIVGSAGSGKSMFLDQATAHAVYLGQNVCLATLELPEAEHFARLTSNLTGIPTKSVLNGRMGDAKRAISALSRQLGACVVKYFTPQATTVEDVILWKRETEQRIGQQVSLLTVDYADKLTVTNANVRETDYKVQNRVYEALRIHAEQTGTWVWTASQAKRGDGRRKRIDLDDVADSMGKVRVADLVVTLGLTEQQQDVNFYIAKNRTGRAMSTVGPLPTDFAMGRMAAISRRESAF